MKSDGLYEPVTVGEAYTGISNGMSVAGLLVGVLTNCELSVTAELHAVNIRAMRRKTMIEDLIKITLQFSLSFLSI
jgi:hypothetical protein